MLERTIYKETSICNTRRRNNLNTAGPPSIDKEDFRFLKSGLGWDNDSAYRALLPYKFGDQTSFAITQYLCGNVY